METPLLATKLYVPAPPPHVVPRPRLLQRIDAGLAPHVRLTLLSAPAGFGKTTLLGEWIAHTAEREPDTRFAWLSLDEADEDPARFLSYVVAALQRVHADVGVDALHLLHGGQAPSYEPALTALVNDLSETLGETFVILDDYHAIDSKPVNGILAFLVDRAPPQLRLVIATRFDPPLPLARLRSRGGLTEIRASDLRFTSEEAANFLNEVMGLRLSAKDVSALEQRTEGWIAGLQLAAVSMRGRADVAGFIESFTGSHRFVLDYLAEEVLQRQPDDIRRFLLRTSVLERMTGPLCDTVTGREDGGDVLELLERANLFVVPLDDRRLWYRYHHLFAEVLRSRLHVEHPDLASELHRAAAEWFERNGLPEEAVRHALSGGDVDRAATLVELQLPAIRRDRRDATLLGWLDRIPDDVVRRRPVLSTFYAWGMLVAGNVQAVEPWLRDAEQALSDTDSASVRGEELDRLPTTIAIYRAALAQGQGDLEACREHARHALTLAAPDDHLARSGAAGYLGLAAYAEGDIETAVRTFPETISALHAAGHTADELSSTVVLADMWIAQGRLVEARTLYEKALRTVTSQGAPVVTGATADLHVAFGELMRELGDLPAARHHLQIGDDLGEHASLTENRYRWFVAMALVKRAEGDLDGAIALLDEAERLYRRGFLPEVRPVAAVKARVWIAQGGLTSAQGWAREQGLSSTDELRYLREFEHLTLVRLLVARGRLHGDSEVIHEALGFLHRLLKVAEADGRHGSVNEILVLQALAREAYGDRDRAVAILRRVLLATEAEGHVRLFLDEGAPMEALLRAADVSRVAPSRVTSLLPAAADAAPEAPALLEPLSDRELEVLRLLATELSGPEIARQVFVSVNTLRTHTKHIFAKLDVNTRRAAVRRAADLGLL
jgi:LuxR family maltose regulon positive regulatory protein